MFSTNRPSSEPITESKNVSAWESLILDLTESSHHDEASDDSAEGGWFRNGGASSSSLPLSTCSHNGEEKMGQKIQHLPQSLTNIHDNKAAVTNAAQNGGEQQTPTTLESPSQLKDWMAYHSTKYAPHANHMGRKMDAAYALKAAQIALSLAKYLGRQFQQDKDMDVDRREDLPSIISFEDIIVDNVIVTNVDSGEAVLESTSSPSGATKNNGGVNTERRQVLALGMTLYELFTQGSPPPTRLQQSLKSSGSVLSFGKSLRISEQSEEDDDRGASGGDRRKNKDDDDDGMDETDQKESFARKQRRRECGDKGEE